MRGTSQEQINLCNKRRIIEVTPGKTKYTQDGGKSQENKSIVDENSAGGAANEIVGVDNAASCAKVRARFQR